MIEGWIGPLKLFSKKPGKNLIDVASITSFYTIRTMAFISYRVYENQRFLIDQTASNIALQKGAVELLLLISIAIKSRFKAKSEKGPSSTTHHALTGHELCLFSRQTATDH